MSHLPLDRRRVILSLALAGGAAATPGLAKPAARRSAKAAARAAPASLPGDMVLGSPIAPQTVVEYASVGCPVCGRWHKEVYPAFKSKWIDTGKVRFVFREMLVGGEQEIAVAAAGFLLARAAGPGKYFPVVDAVFASQPALFDDPEGVIGKIAAKMGVPHDRFEAIIRDPAALKALDARVQANSRQDAVNATPTFVVNGLKLEAGYQTLDALDAALAKTRAA